MNPFEYWYRTDEQFKEFLDGYFKAHIDHSILPKDMQTLLRSYYSESSTTEKTMAITVLAALKYYFG
jgi:asparagine synthase (glutamine-hydrolysing)